MKGSLCTGVLALAALLAFGSDVQASPNLSASLGLQDQPEGPPATKLTSAERKAILKAFTYSFNHLSKTDKKLVLKCISEHQSRLQKQFQKDSKYLQGEYRSDLAELKAQYRATHDKAQQLAILKEIQNLTKQYTLDSKALTWQYEDNRLLAKQDCVSPFVC